MSFVLFLRAALEREPFVLIVTPKVTIPQSTILTSYQNGTGENPSTKCSHSFFTT